MPTELKELQEIVAVKPEPPETTPSLRDALGKAEPTVGCYYFTQSLAGIFKEVFDCAANKKGQGFWVQAEYGAGKTHFLATMTLLLTRKEEELWNCVHDAELRNEYRDALTKLKLFPVTFSLLGAGEDDAEDRLMRQFEKEIIQSLPPDLRDKISITSDDLAVRWFEQDANDTQKAGLTHYFEGTHGCMPDEFRKKSSKQQFGAAIRKSGLNIDLKGAFRERFAHIYQQITEIGGYEGLLFVVDEFRSWQDRHQGRPSFEEGCQVLETLAYYLPVENHMNVLTLVASQGECPQKLLGGQKGDRFIVRSLLASQNKTDYGEIVAYRVREVQPNAEVDIDGYYTHCREQFKFIRQSQTSKNYFKAIFPFQPRCFEVVRRMTQSFERHGLPSARAGINMAYETLSQETLIRGRRLLVVADLLSSEQLRLGLTSDVFRSGYESYQNALDVVDSSVGFSGEEKDIARRLIGTLYLWAVAMPEGARGMQLTELAEATMTSIEGVTPDDAVLDLVTRLRTEIPQIQYDKTHGARFDVAESAGGIFQRQFPALKRKAKADTSRQNVAWVCSLFWDFRDIGGATSAEGIDRGFLEGLAQRDAQQNPSLPGKSSAKTTVSRVVYGGEVLTTQKWESKFGEEIRDPAVHFRIVYLTEEFKVPDKEIGDIRISVCTPSALSDETRENLADLVACDEFLKEYSDQTHPMAGEDRDRAKSRRQDAIGRILKNQIEEFRRGKIVTAKGYGILADEVFKTAAASRGGREAELASRVLEKAYDEPLFVAKDFKKDFNDADARKVYHGLFASPNVRSTADNSARDNFGPALGLVKKNNPAVFAPEGGPVGWITEKLKQVDDLALSDLVKNLCRPPHGLTEPMVTLCALAAVRAGIGDGRGCVVKLREGTDFTLTSGKKPIGGKLTAHNIPHAEWSSRLEKALLGARLQISTELGWNAVLDYARVLDPELKTASSPDEENARNEELCRILKNLASQVDSTSDELASLATVLNGSVPLPVNELCARLESIAATEHFQEFHAVVTQSYPKVEAFQFAMGTFGRAVQLAEKYPAVQQMKSYLDNTADLGEGDLRLTVTSIGGQLVFDSLLTNPGKVAALIEQFAQFKDKYCVAYRKYHQDYHQAVASLTAELEDYSQKIVAIKRLNQLELGAPLGASLENDFRRLADGLNPCPDKDYAKIDQHPICATCRLQGEQKAPQEQAAALKSGLDATVAELLGRVAQGAVRKILESSNDGSIKTLLDVIVATQVDRIPDVLIPEVIERIKELLRDANLEHRDLPVRDLLGERLAVEEQEIDALVDQIRQRLKDAFAKAKSETGGKKRIRFFLK